MGNSSLVTCTRISPNRTSPRNHKIDTITIHCTAGQCTAQQLLNMNHITTYSTSKGASCNYVVGKDGSIGLCVPESDRSWCSSSSSNDHRAITIEVSSDATHPYAVTSAAYSALIDLLVDICQRNHIPELKWKGDKSLIGQTDKQNMTVHRWFAAKACPGDWLYQRHGQIAAEVNQRLKGEVDMTKEEVKALVLEVLAEVEANRAAKPASDWAVQSQVCSRAAQAGFTDGTRPRSYVTREEVNTMLLAVLEQVT